MKKLYRHAGKIPKVFGGVTEEMMEKLMPGLRALFGLETSDIEAPERVCTCHPDDNPPQPCAKQYALSECKAAAELRKVCEENGE